jgi:hypothetical protein
MQKHTLSVSEVICERERQRKKVRSKAPPTRYGFEIITKGRLGPDNLGTITPIKRNPTLLDLFHDLCPQEKIFESLIEEENIYSHESRYLLYIQGHHEN